MVNSAPLSALPTLQILWTKSAWSEEVSYRAAAYRCCGRPPRSKSWTPPAKKSRH